MKVGFYAGSFDPFTIGHLSVVKKASELFDKVIVGIGENDSKKSRYDRNKMCEAINKTFALEKIDNAECVVFNSLTVDEAKKYGTTFLIRGIRNGMDYEYEENLALINFEISGLDTIYVRAGKFGYVSSSMVYELIKRGKEVASFLPEEVNKLIKE